MLARQKARRHGFERLLSLLRGSELSGEPIPIIEVAAGGSSQLLHKIKDAL